MTSGPIHPLDARRAYYVFLTHLSKAHAAGLRWPVDTVTEFGVGTSLGIGMCALLAGAKRYIGFDALSHMDAKLQAHLLDELRTMFVERAPAFNDAGVKAFDFPSHILNADLAASSASDSAHKGLLTDLDRLASGTAGISLMYVAPYDTAIAERFANSADLLLSTATLEHFDDMEAGYRLFHSMLKPDGLMSHSIDFKSHGFGLPREGTRCWNEHWLLTEAEWREVTRGKSYSINRLPCSDHLKLMIRAGFQQKIINKRMQEHPLKWSDLAPRFQWMTSEDLGCSGVHVVSVKQ